MKKKIFKILKKSINSFENLDKIELIATFGSITKFDNTSFEDLDIIIISNKKIHNSFISHLKNQFKKENLESIVFETITKKQNRKKEDQVFIHDLNYRSLSDLLKKEWKSVINSMKSEMVVLHGDKNFQNKLTYLRIFKKDLFNPLLKWCKKISSETEFKIFQSYLLKIIPKLSQNYNYLDLSDLKQIKALLSKNIPWKEKQREIIAKLF